MSIFRLTKPNQGEVPFQAPPVAAALFQNHNQEALIPWERSPLGRDTCILFRGLTRVSHHRLLQAGCQGSGHAVVGLSEASEDIQQHP